MPSDGLSDPQMLEVGSCRPECSVPTSGPITCMLDTHALPYVPRQHQQEAFRSRHTARCGSGACRPDGRAVLGRCCFDFRPLHLVRSLRHAAGPSAEFSPAPCEKETTVLASGHWHGALGPSGVVRFVGARRAIPFPIMPSILCCGRYVDAQQSSSIDFSPCVLRPRELPLRTWHMQPYSMNVTARQIGSAGQYRRRWHPPAHIRGVLRGRRTGTPHLYVPPESGE